jgi:Family of unknown function (DUF7009)
MKLRLLDDSVRLRLSQSEVNAADRQGIVEGRTRFPDGSIFTFALEALPGTGTRGAAIAANRLVVRLPAAEIAAWANDDAAVSLHGDLTLPEGGSLSLLVEKDFRCLTPREGEDQSDMFPNPDESC